MIGDIFQNIFYFPRILYRLYNKLVILGWKKFTPSKLGETRLQKLQNGESFFAKKPLKIAHGLNFARKIIPVLYWFEAII